MSEIQDLNEARRNMNECLRVWLGVLYPGERRAIIDAMEQLIEAMVANVAASEREACASRILSQRYVPEDMRRQLADAIRTHPQPIKGITQDDE